MKQMRIAAALALAGGLFAASAQAQVYTPPFMSPIPASDFGIYVSEIGDIGIEGIWRRMSRGGSDVGFRVGYADVGDGALLAGIEVRNPVVLAGAPIGVAFTAAGQGVIGDNPRLGGQVGFTVGQALPAGAFTVTPYIHPRLAVLARLGGDDPPVEGDDDLDLEVLADIGADFTFPAGVALRIDFNLSEGASWGIGLAWRSR